ncbi:MAG: hypothetical protein HQM12_04675 [SAR324 cluster bacterium]|nr:hypothetical protein [SAR324 cluster bacterium]MBF0351640.1 hypothetical protein [SAR324 cluster bacterium]
MKKKIAFEETDRDGEEQLSVLIRQAGNEARLKKIEAMDHHFNKLRDVIAEVVSRKQGSLPT